jgi:hypothetical protein
MVSMTSPSVLMSSNLYACSLRFRWPDGAFDFSGSGRLGLSQDGHSEQAF